MTEIITYQEIVEGDEVTKYKLNKNNGTILIDLEKLLNATVTECEWLGEDKSYLELMYYEWDSTEHFAIVSKDGDLVKKGIKEIHHYIPEVELFVVMFTGFGLGENDSAYYSVANDDWKMSVINRYGDYILEPIFNKIQHFDDEELFYVDGSVYNFKGEFIKKEE
ncbi:hypothetical protein J8L85_12600 [Maribacter sp. MMG018]|uniref:hypothetical protein n=1 Tax=Maribacter sp. MMG018 TaxID=2822688 RepID=UPI001B38E810|nr:hypothetical protein [Maribacter sp. MMG018]MBQ4915284.1 hypothetical protein [Maribacter sp. MMG018]